MLEGSAPNLPAIPVNGRFSFAVDHVKSGKKLRNNCMKFLQISRAYSEDHSDKMSATFKCMNCYSTFGLCLPVTWQFCPQCGSKIEPHMQEISRKKYYDNAGYSTMDKHGNFIKLVPPVFTLMMECKIFLTDDEWEAVNMFPLTSYHDTLKRYVRTSKDYDYEKYRIRLVPSNPLNLP